ncbi:uncharacterized protein BHQ10_009897 [Talaromyces amestolkiae]|uniref:Uncharacterized protein n=1 Tax=Talaromyces amestolkiae TaxID=1196081 RepID=A0A364LDI8_TALAM|nr:uncharacterized protein BHQ10_009897 [Talaromyces amestolkiae]RAO73885.1 hypothetical protein BHQ10_009897 [Talaromyces amestolkiae]
MWWTSTDVDTPRYERTESIDENPNRALLSLVENLTAKVNTLESRLHQQQAFSDTMSNEPLPLSSVNTPVIPQDIDGNNEIDESSQSSSEVEDAATILEFLAWGRRKDPKYQDLITIGDDDIPTTTNYMRHHYDVAALMPQVQDAIVSSNTLYTRYEKVLEYDQQLRLLATVGLPYYLQNVPLDPSWPCYVPWARRALAISTSHKVIMIHRKFLGMSFVNPMFSRTRRTCVAAARTIVKELKETETDGPVLWIHHAFVVTAGVSELSD